MKILDRYIVRNFLCSAAMWFVVLMAMRIVADLFINLDEFVEQKETFSAIASYYGYQSFAYFSQLGGVIIVAAATFTLAMMNHTNELSAMLASGVSLHRVVWPMILCAMLLGGLIVLDQELVIPRFADKLARSRDDVAGGRAFRVALIADGRGSVWYSESFNPSENKMTAPVLALRDSRQRQVAGVFGAEAHPAEVRGRVGWVIKEAVLSPAGGEGSIWPHTPDTRSVHSVVGPRKLLEQGLISEAATSRAAADRPVVAIRPVGVDDPVYGMRVEADRFALDEPLAGDVQPDQLPPDEQLGGELQNPAFTFRSRENQVLCIFIASSARWRGGEGGGYWELKDGVGFCPSDLTRDDLVLRRSSRWMDYLSSRQLTELMQLKRTPDPDAARLVKHVRLTDPINNLILLLLGLPFILSRERDIKASASLCLLIVGTFYAFIYLCRYVGLPSAWAAWLPILLFGPVAVVMLDAVKT
jgi:lipopolysaccharide export LptBFGC system permease protein LptF